MRHLFVLVELRHLDYPTVFLIANGKEIKVPYSSGEVPSSRFGESPAPAFRGDSLDEGGDIFHRQGDGFSKIFDPRPLQRSAGWSCCRPRYLWHHRRARLL